MSITFIKFRATTTLGGAKPPFQIFHFQIIITDVASLSLSLVSLLSLICSCRICSLVQTFCLKKVSALFSINFNIGTAKLQLLL